MEKDVNFSMICETFHAKRDGEVAWLCFSENLMLHATDLQARDKVLDYLALVSNNTDIKILIVIGSPDKSGRDEYLKFYRMVAESQMSLDAIQRMINVLNQFVLSLVTLDKFVVHANSGKVIAPFMNIGLACDYRIIADNTVYQNPNIALGLVPKGGGTYFLPRLIGLNKTMDVLLAEKDITAAEAMEIGLVNKVVPKASLEDEVLKVARRFAAYPPKALSGIKTLLNFTLKDLSDLMELENQILMKTVRSKGFLERVKNSNLPI